jgi:hypothetical protein
MKPCRTATSARHSKGWIFRINCQPAEHARADCRTTVPELRYRHLEPALKLLPSRALSSVQAVISFEEAEEKWKEIALQTCQTTYPYSVVNLPFAFLVLFAVTRSLFHCSISPSSEAVRVRELRYKAQSPVGHTVGPVSDRAFHISQHLLFHPPPGFSNAI